MTNFDRLKKYYNLCKEEESLKPGDPRYVDFDALGMRGPCCREELLRRIEMDDGWCHQIFSGFKGGGKTTELLDLKQCLEQAGYLVIYGDAKDYMNLTMPISVGEVLMSLCAVFDDYLEANLEKGIARENIWQRMGQFLGSEINIQEFGIQAPGVEIKAAIKNNPSFKKELQKFLGSRLQLFKDQAFDFIGEAIALAMKDYREKNGKPCKSVVLIYDSLEQLSGDSPFSQEVRESLKDVFFRLAHFLKINCHVVYTVPPWICLLAGIDQSWKSCHFAMCRIQKRDGARDKEGVKAMLEFIDKRVPLKEVFGEGVAADQDSVVNSMIDSSGGYMRDVLRMLREFILRIKREELLPLPASRQREIWTQVKRILVDQYQSPVFEDDKEWLAEIGERHEIKINNEDQLKRITSFFDAHFVLCYMDEAGRYYDLHPLVKELVLARENGNGTRNQG